MEEAKLPGAGPFSYEGNELGILLVHGGGGGTCADLRPMAEDLHQKAGYTVRVPLLPGFGTSPKILRKTPVENIKKALEDNIISLRQKCEKIFLGGHSMGGILTLIMAAKFDFNGIFTISAPMGIRRPYPIPKMLWKVLTHIPYFPVDYKNLKKETDGKWVGYKKIPINMNSKMKKLLKDMKRNLQKIKCPALIMQGRLDSTIKNESMNVIYSTISSERKKKIWLEHNNHSILNCPDHQIIVAQILQFLQNGIQ